MGNMNIEKGKSPELDAELSKRIKGFQSRIAIKLANPELKSEKLDV